MKTLIFITTVLLTLNSFAYETDQFTVPPTPLADVGDDLVNYLFTNMEKTIERVNHKEDLLKEIEKLEKEKGSKKKIAALKNEYEMSTTPEGITSLIAKSLGHDFFIQDQRDGVFGITLSIFPYKKNEKDGRPILFDPNKMDNIYSYSGLRRIVNSTFFVFCSTLRAFDIYFGVDKLGHMFNQGYTYYGMYLEEKKNSASELVEEKTQERILSYGVKSENGVFGKFVDGVYSNGDLSANISGFHFYRNLFESIELDDATHGPLLALTSEGKVEMNEVDRKAFVSKFFSNHLNEGLNPSHIEKLQRKSVAKAIKKRCESFLKFYSIADKSQAEEISHSMLLWHGKPYGHNNENLLRVDDLCFQ